jgi:predicted NBD/HSP70 family sugar kinase
MGREQIRKRRQNQYAILRALHFGGSMRRGEIGTQFGIRKSSITSIVSELIEVGIVREETPGNIRSLIALDKQQYHAVVAAVDTHRVCMARIYTDGRIAQPRELPLSEGNTPNEVMDTLVFGFRDMCRRKVGRPFALGVAMPGVIDPETGICHKAVNLDDWNDIPLGELLQKRLGNGVYVDNDVRCQLWDCTWFDHLAQDTENLLYVSIADGVACAIMTHGRLIVGERCSAGEVGHVHAGSEDRLCRCGRRDCLETYCSIPALVGEIQARRPDLRVQNAADIERAASSDGDVVAILGSAAARLARAIAGIVVAIDPLYVVVGSGNRLLSERIQPLLQRHLFTELIGLNVGHSEIRIADATQKGTIKGIAGLAINREFHHGRFRLRRMD